MSIQYMHEQTDSSAKHKARCLNCPHKTDSFAQTSALLDGHGIGVLAACALRQQKVPAALTMRNAWAFKSTSTFAPLGSLLIV